ncbi:SDR family NAD(P)-dependent oxidoreductase [Streptomyces sp. NBC_01465]|uniref:SDR family NAD(P)-dependent oxidoreductase n=1 Tax=Streptomyces sp. NBC_01465 TaxID=2903878 RepID=UPI002E32BBEA|nr:SDR family NAD(P)-dependent oxidoreductase [Streptomyces sp. NBC_01465]
MNERKVLVTGVTGGIGGAVARRLAADGWQVFAAYRRQGDEGPLRAQGFVPVPLDLADETSPAAAAEVVGDRLDALVNSAGILRQGPVELVPAEVLRRQFEVNVIAQTAVIRAFLPALRATGGRIVNIGAISGRVDLPFIGPVAASKAAFASLSGILRMELRHQGVQVSLVEPGAVATEIFDKAAKAMAEDGWAGSAEAQRRYARALAAYEEMLAKMKPGPVEPVVKAVRTALNARRPAARYTAGRDARSIAALRMLPTGVRERILLRATGLTAEAFAG